jgi:3-methylcrotonyl-CoA carboxylase alpha subunit
MIRRLLIANRGEIAVRIARTCRRLGIETVAVYSDADRQALHVREADRGRRLGPPEAARSYLDARAIVAAALAAGADAIHPGYGFLSESAEFAEACAAAGLRFVGPRPEAIRAMGSKQRARALAMELAVPIVPGAHPKTQDDATLEHEARRIGYPLLVKASAGGGGRGMRVVVRSEELAEALKSARREALSGFGDATLVLERYVERARHVEVQVLGDRHGRRVALFDRECSIQRRHQKLIEEAPAPRLGEAVRAGLRAAALRIADAIDYESAGTIEFLVDDRTDEFFFLEMNTRLQVEHPITELITGLDLVELQLRVAAGEALPSPLGPAEPMGVAIEARICAERPEQGFLPATGTVCRVAVPAIDGVRIDAGVAAGDVVTAYYDSMLAKVIAHGRDREEARRRLVAALEGSVLAGVDCNVDLLRDTLETPAFRAATVSTRFLEFELAAGRAQRPDDEEETVDRVAAAVRWVLEIEGARRGTIPSPWDRLGPWRVTRRSGQQGWTVIHLRAEDGAASVVRLSGTGGRRYEVDAGSSPFFAEAWWSKQGELRMEIDGALFRRAIDLEGSNVWLSGGRRHRRFTVVSREALAAAREAEAAEDPRNLVAPFPGLVTAIEVAPGERVEAGRLLVVMEAMKMVHSLRASGAGSVCGIHCQAGRTVTAGDLLVEFEAISPSGEAGRST